MYTERQQRLKLRDMATISELVWSRRSGSWAQLPCADLCVGDVVCVCVSYAADGAGDSEAEEVAKGALLAADAIVVEGSAVVDESLLTGETMPIQKFAVGEDERKRDPQASEDKKHFLYAGTQLLHAAGAAALPGGVVDGAIAVVSHVGARSCRGELLRTLLFGAPLKLAMFTEALIVLVLLLFIGACDFLSVNLSYSFTLSSIISASFMIISLVSPLLSVAILGGQLASAKRLSAVKKGPALGLPPLPAREGSHVKLELSHGAGEGGGLGEEDSFRIFVRDVDRVALVGKIDMMCFDKTGTITKTGLDLIGLVPSGPGGNLGGGGASGSGVVALGDCVGQGAGGDGVAEGKGPGMLAVALAVTHTVSRLHTQLIGHQVDVCDMCGMFAVARHADGARSGCPVGLWQPFIV